MGKRGATLLCLLAASCGGGGGGGSSGGGTGPVATTPLTITSGATGGTPENAGTAAYQVTTSGGSGAVTYTLQGGGDSAAFTINSTGAVFFKTPPDFEQPTDSDKNNSYIFVVGATDSTGTTTRDVTVTVTNLPDQNAAVQVGGAYARADDIASLSGSPKILVAERGGTIWLVDPTTRDKGTLYLTVTGLYDDNGRRGLMSIAAAPDYATSGTLYAFVSTGDAIEVRRYGRTAAGLGDPASADVVLRVPSSTTSPDVGGWIGYAGDNAFYVTTGLAGTTASSNSLLGKVLRIDLSRDDFPADPLRDYAVPNGNPFKFTGGPGEVYAGNFRDPWRGAVDENDLFLVDRNNATLQGSTPLYQITLGNLGSTFGDDGNPQTYPPVLRAGPTLIGAGSLIPGGIYRGGSPDLIRQIIFSAAAGFGTTGYSGIYATPSFYATTADARSCCRKIFDTFAVAFGRDQYRNVYYTDGSSLYAIQYR